MAASSTIAMAVWVPILLKSQPQIGLALPAARRQPHDGNFKHPAPGCDLSNRFDQFQPQVLRVAESWYPVSDELSYRSIGVLPRAGTPWQDHASHHQPATALVEIHHEFGRVSSIRIR